MALDTDRTDVGGNEGIGAIPSFTAADFLGGSSGADTDAAGSGDGFDPAIHISRDKRNADGSFTRKRGRRPGNSANSGGSRKTRHTASVEHLAKVLAIVHAGIASATKCPELNIEDAESEALAKSVATVLDEFDITPDPKIQAIVGLVTTAGVIYGPRVYMIRQRKKEEANTE